MAPAYSDREPTLSQPGSATAPLDAEYVDDEAEYSDEPEPEPRRSIWRLLLPILGVVVLVACAGIDHLTGPGV